MFNEPYWGIPEDLFWVIVWTAVWWVSGRWLAIKKGRWSGWVGFNLVVFGPLALLIVLFMHTDPDGIAKRRVKEGKRKWCPFCHRDIHLEAVKCEHCGTDIEESEVAK